MTLPTLQRSFLSLLLTLVAGACSGGGGCGGCGMEPLPEGGLPTDQTVEGGAQLRISDTGFNTLTQLLPAVLQDTLGQGTCIPSGSFSVIDYCYNNDGSCTDACQADISIDSVVMDVPQDDELRLAVQFDVHIDVPVLADLFLFEPSCDIVATADDILFDVIVGFDINPESGELELALREISDVNIVIDIDASDCGSIVDSVASLATGLVNGIGSILGVDFVRNLLTPVIEPIIQNMLPDPLGVEGVADVGAMLAGFSPSTKSKLETRLVPGGYVHLENDGLSLGIITGFNADEDPSTRTADLDSEPALCVPPFAAPDFGAAPANLAQSVRANFMLNPANLFRGDPETTSDVLIGASETMLDQLGHHLVSSGALCMSMGTELIPQLTVGTLGVLVPSLSALGSEDGDDPLLLVTRPAKPIDFSIGEGTEASPALTLRLTEFNIDFYAFLFERYTRAFTATLDMEVGINLDFIIDEDGNPAVMPILVGLNADEIGITIQNEDFLAEDRATLESVFPILLNLVLPLISDGLGSFALPELAGFKLDDLAIERVTTSEDEFLAISASLGAGTTMAALGQVYPSVGALIQNMKLTEGVAVSAKARLHEVIAPSPEAMRAALAGQAGQVPAVVLDLDTHDQMGRELEWTWNLEGGLWRSFMKGGRITLEDPAFHIQGKYELELRSRAIGDYRSWDPETTRVDIVIDSVGPQILTSSVQRNDKTLAAAAFDSVYGNEVQIAYGSAGADAPSTAWADGEISMQEALVLAASGELRIFARDPQGNQSSETYHLSNSVVETNTGGCSTGGNTGLAGLFFVLLALGLRSRPRRFASTSTLGLALIASLSLTQACTCSSSPVAAPMCEIDIDCMEGCEAGQIGQCLDEECRCLADVPYGSIGQYSSMDVALDGTVWVSAYNSKHGDLMIASTRELGRIPDPSWQFVDGVPDGPIVLPTHGVRGGIKAGGDDVGLYTDLAVAADGTVMVSYFDTSSGSLKFAANQGGEWQSHTVDAGDLSDDDTNTTKIIGQYSSLSISSTGIPAIAYFVHLGVGTAEARTEVRFAQAASNAPRGPDAWQVREIDSADVPLDDAEADVLTIPYGTGLFVEVVRDTSDLPVTAYYDRINGELKLARFDAENDVFKVESLDAQGDVGWYPSVVVDENDTVHVSYVDAVNRDLIYINDLDREPVLVDDGYRIVGTTADGLPLPEFHFVGDDSSLVLTGDGLYIVYQDATSHEMWAAYPSGNGGWGRSVIVGDEAPFAGAYGFFANAAFNGTDVTMSSWVLDQSNADSWVELFNRSIVIE